MGLYLKKSVRVGPFRFNLSKSGIGVSCGIRGLRIGTGPRGNYIHAGRGGIYYRKTFSTDRPRSPVMNQPIPEPISQAASLDPTIGQFHAVDEGTSAIMQDGSSQSLLDELNEKHGRFRLWPWLFLLGIASVGVLIYQHFPEPIIGLVTCAFAAATIIAAYRDTLKKTTVLLYDFDDDVLGAFANLDATFSAAAASQRIWHVQAEARVLDRKYHAGASSVLDAENVRLSKSAPSGVKTNILPMVTPLGRRTLYFFPDRLLVLDAVGFGAINYQNLRVELEKSKFVTGELTAPSDARVIDCTWRYVNKRGGPDHRFHNNPQLPVIETGDLTFSSDSGLSGQLRFSNTGAAQAFVDGIRQFIAVAFRGTPSEASPPALTPAPSVVPDSTKEIPPSKAASNTIAAIAAIFFVGISVAIFVLYQWRNSTNSTETSVQNVPRGENVSASSTPVSPDSPPAPYSPIMVRRALPVDSAAAAATPAGLLTYRVANLKAGDTLSVRAGPGSDYPIVVSLRRGTRGIVLGAKRAKNGSTIWQEISANGQSGWVNEIYLEAEGSAPAEQ
jgi:hypothetical protein